MKVLVEAVNTPTIYKLGGDSAVLRIEAIKGFTSSTGHLIPPSRGQNDDIYLEVPISIAAEEMLIQGFEFDSTQDAYPWDSEILGDVPGYRASIVTSRNKKIPYFPQFKVPTLADGDPSMTWGEIRIFNRTFRRRFAGLDRYINVEEVQEWIQNAVGLLNKASDINPGLAAGSHPPLDPTFPIHIAQTDPLWQLLLGGQRLATAAGRSTLAGAPLVVPTTAATLTAVITITSMDRNVTGELRAVDIVDGVSFTIESSNELDEGEVGWIITNPYEEIP